MLLSHLIHRTIILEYHLIFVSYLNFPSHPQNIFCCFYFQIRIQVEICPILQGPALCYVTVVGFLLHRRHWTPRDSAFPLAYAHGAEAWAELGARERDAMWGDGQRQSLGLWSQQQPFLAAMTSLGSSPPATGSWPAGRANSTSMR